MGVEAGEFSRPLCRLEHDTLRLHSATSRQCIEHPDHDATLRPRAGRVQGEGRERRDGLPERYEISQVTKLDGDRWRFDARVKYGRVDVTLPVVVPLVWAGDTPMVSITNFSIPGLGDEFGARVLFYDNRYAGTWDHGEYGGMMYGTIAPADGM